MSALPSEAKVIPTNHSPSNDPQGQDIQLPIEAIQQRRSQELVIGLCGAVGSGVESLRTTLENQLRQHSYHVEHIKLSELISTLSNCHDEVAQLRGYVRYTRLQDLGDALRKKYKNSIVAELAIRQIAILRNEKFGNGKADAAVRNTKKAAYIVDQFKNPDEIKLFQEEYIETIFTYSAY
ncbi:hypothetical protein [Shewanella sp.]|uniref:hypothetical protein n=1 Tax=Shewanella sp. TaxID=50422 RepID=UPI003A97368E